MDNCNVCTAAGIDHNEVVSKCLESPYWTGRLLCGFDKMSASFHQNIALWLAKKIDEGKRRFIIMTPRDHYKTTLFGVSTMLWFTLRDIETRILYMMASCTEAEKKLDVVKDSLTNSEQLRHFFPDVVPDTSSPRCKWTLNHIRLPQRKTRAAEGTVEARGMNSKVTGGHFKVHIFDDLIDETMADSVVEQEKVINFLKRSDALFVDIKNDIEIIIGTRWPGPFYDWLLDESGIVDEYETLVIGCYVDQRYRDFMASIGKKVLLEDGEPIFPEEFTRESLEMVCKKAGTFDFSHQWLNIKEDEDEIRFKEEDFQIYKYTGGNDGIIYSHDRVVKFDDLYRTLTVDPATGEHSKTDKSAITVCGYDKSTGNIFVLDAWHGRVLPDELIRKTIEYARKWDIHVCGPEDVSYQKTFKYFLKQQMNKERVHFRIVPVKPGGKGKGSRIIDALQPFVSNRQLFVRREHNQLVRELTTLRVVGGKVIGKSPNLADSLAYHPEFWSLSSTPKKAQRRSNVVNFMSSFINDKHEAAYGLECTT